jgi:hypothetical protein
MDSALANQLSVLKERTEETADRVAEVRERVISATEDIIETSRGRRIHRLLQEHPREAGRALTDAQITSLLERSAELYQYGSKRLQAKHGQKAIEQSLQFSRIAAHLTSRKISDGAPRHGYYRGPSYRTYQIARRTFPSR